MKSKTNEQQWAALAAPFPFEQVQIRCLRLTNDKTKAAACFYVDAHTARARLDQSFGPDAWDFEVREFPSKNGKIGIVGRLTVRTVEGPVVTREDGAELTDIEPLKGGISNAFKRACTALGMFDLSEIDAGYHPCTTYKNGKGEDAFQAFTDPAINQLKRLYDRATASGIPHPAFGGEAA